MYHCHLRLYLVGSRRDILKPAAEVTPPANFSYTFLESEELDAALIRKADVIFCCLPGMDPGTAMKTLADHKQAEAELILLAEREQIPALSPWFPAIKDIWTLPMEEEELLFRFCRWQDACQQEKDAWETRQYLEATINSIPSLIWYKDKGGIHEKVNDSFCQTVNKSKAQVEGRGHAYIWDVEQDDPACIESERVVMETRKTCIAEETIQAGGDKRILTTYKSPLYDLDGSVMGTVGVGIDITQERNYEQEILRKTQILETIFTTMDCGIICHSIDGQKIISINEAALKILGYKSQDELMENGFFMTAQSVLEEDKALLQDRIHSLKTPGDSTSVEYRVVHENGSIVYVLGNLKLVEENGQLYYQRFLLDCTDQKLLEQQERLENERRQSELIHALSIDYQLVCYFDLGTETGHALRTSGCQLGVLDSIFAGQLSMQESMRRYAESCVYAEDKEAFLQIFEPGQLAEELAYKKIFYTNYRTLCCGEVRYFQMKAVRIGDWQGGDCGIVLGIRNVDFETQEEMKKKKTLEDALYQANRANKAKSTFLSNMSHDIRTPMNAIVGFTTLALTHMEHIDQVEEYLKKILTSGNHLVSLINDVLDMSRIESGKMRLDAEPCSLPDILHGLRSIVQADVRAKELDFYLDAVDVINEDICCDKLRLNQVLLNLLSNSIKYTGAGGVISLRIIEKPGAPDGFANYQFIVKDNGIGMSEEFVSHIFEPFERERNSTISGIQGTGLGMAITKNIVDMMDGAIEVHSEPGVGSEFIATFTFPLQLGPKKPSAIPMLKNCRALVADDDFNTCDSVSYMLQQIGMRAEWTLSGREAVLRTRQAIMRGDTYSVYVIDWLMPDMNGVEVARRIRKEVGDDVPIIILTAYDWQDIEEEAKAAGVTGFCSKPLFFSELRRCLGNIVDTDAEDAEPATEAPPRQNYTGRILLAEDNELNQEIAVAILEEAGFTVEVAGNGEEAIEMLKASDPGYYRLILMDVQMPVMDGYTATRKIRAMKDTKLSSIPILAMTANAFQEDRQRALGCGMNGHIAKPIDIDKLMETLDSVLTD